MPDAAPEQDDATAGADDQRPSKSQRKREMHARQDLGARLVDLSAEQLRRLPLDETLQGAIAQARQLRAHEARRRQLQYIGKLMRSADYDAIQTAYDDLLGGSRSAVALMHRCERLRERLIDEEDFLPEFLQEHPRVDTQWLRAKLRAARQERAEGKAPRHARELYKWLHELLEPARTPGSGSEAA